MPEQRQSSSNDAHHTTSLLAMSISRDTQQRTINAGIIPLAAWLSTFLLAAMPRGGRRPIAETVQNLDREGHVDGSNRKVGGSGGI